MEVSVTQPEAVIFKPEIDLGLSEVAVFTIYQKTINRAASESELQIIFDHKSVNTASQIRIFLHHECRY